ncbi:MAG: hypothetical protein ABIH39_02415 [Candidatus Margulisiibacteriota bacterium]
MLKIITTVNELPIRNSPARRIKKAELSLLAWQKHFYENIITQCQARISILIDEYNNIQDRLITCNKEIGQSKDKLDTRSVLFRSIINKNLDRLIRKHSLMEEQIDTLDFFIKTTEQQLFDYERLLTNIKNRLKTHYTDAGHTESSIKDKLKGEYNTDWILSRFFTGYKSIINTDTRITIENSLGVECARIMRYPKRVFISITDYALGDTAIKQIMPFMNKIICSIEGDFRLFFYPNLTLQEISQLQTRIEPFKNHLLVDISAYSIIDNRENKYIAIGTYNVGRVCWGCLIYDPVLRIAAVAHQTPGPDQVNISMIKTMKQRLIYKGASLERLIFIGSPNIHKKERSAITKLFQKSAYDLPQHFYFDIQTLRLIAISRYDLNSVFPIEIKNQVKKKLSITVRHAIKYYEN